MALKKCRGCSEAVEGWNEICPWCGYTFPPDPAGTPAPRESPDSAQIPLPAAALANSADPGGHVLDTSSQVFGRDLWMEAHLRAISIWYRIGGVLGGLMAIYRGAGSPTPDLITVYFIPLALSIAQFTVGHFLWKYSDTARILAGLLAALVVIVGLFDYIATGQTSSMIALLPVTAWAVALFWALYNRRASRVCSYEYGKLLPLSRTAHPPVFKSPFFWIPFALFVFGCVVVFLIALAITW